MTDQHSIVPPNCFSFIFRGLNGWGERGARLRHLLKMRQIHANGGVGDYLKHHKSS